jgi:hypothetical protein
MSVATTILEQLGGNRFRVMTGAKNFVGSNDSLRFRIPGRGGFAKDGINAIKITLTPTDLYDLEFSRIRGSTVSLIALIKNVYSEDLRRLFTEYTGLQTSLGTMKA